MSFIYKTQRLQFAIHETPKGPKGSNKKQPLHTRAYASSKKSATKPTEIYEIGHSS